MTHHNNVRNFSFYTDARTKDIINEWRDSVSAGHVSELIRDAIKMFYLYPYNVQEMLSRGIKNLDKEEREIFNAWFAEASEQLRQEVREIQKPLLEGNVQYDPSCKPKDDDIL